MAERSSQKDRKKTAENVEREIPLKKCGARNSSEKDNGGEEFPLKKTAENAEREIPLKKNDRSK